MLTPPAPHPPTCIQVCNPDELLHFLSNYLTEICLLDQGMMCYLPSEIAAASVYLANLMLRRVPWDGNLQHYSTYTPRQVGRWWAGGDACVWCLCDWG